MVPARGLLGEALALLRLSPAVSQGGAQGGGGGGGGGRDMVDKDWSREQVQLLVKAVSLHPAGTSKRSAGQPAASLVYHTRP